jgi:hypothetical protein
MSERISIPRKWRWKWEQENPVLPDGQPGIEIDSNRMKVGDGRLHWKDLPWLTGTGTGGGGSLPEDGIISGGEP